MRTALLALMLAFVACEEREPPLPPPLPEEALTQPPQEIAPPTVPSIVLDTKAELLRFAKAGSINGISGIANENKTFFSHEGEGSHRDYWVLMRRIGIDPNLKLRQLFEEPAGTRIVDGETWYIWPGLAARLPDQLIPEKLSFQDRRHLRELIGDEGIARIRAGEAYPGMQTAIAEDGRWLYFMLGPEAEVE